MKKIIILLCFILTSSLYAQDLNNYKYVLVPEKFEFLKETDQYRLNGLTQFLFNKYGFNAYLGKKDLPEDALNNNCLNLFAEVVNESNMFTSKLAIQLKDCRGDVVYTSPFGKSKNKSYKVAYNEALRQAAKDLANLNYKYNGSKDIDLSSALAEQTPVTKISKEVAQKEVKDIVKDQTKEITEEITEEITKELPKDVKNSATKEDKLPSQFFAQKRQKQGWLDYNIVDSDGVLYFVFYSTGKEDMYLVEQSKNQDKMLCFKKDNLWHLVSRDATKMEIKVFNIQFPKE